MNGSASTDANFDSLTYSWMLTTVPVGSTDSLTVDSTNATKSTKSTFTPIEVGVYVATLLVNDSKANSLPATVAITVTS